MRRCTAIKANGERCAQPASGPEGYCWAHDPAHAERRSRQASRAARAKANRDVRELKAELRALISEVRSGELDRNDAAVMVQAYRVLKDYLELERRVKETDELKAEIEELKREHGAA